MTYDEIIKLVVTAHDWALHRYGIISPAVSISGGEKISDILAQQAAQVHQRPDGTVHRYNVATLRGWFSTYLADGFDGLKPKIRMDKGTFRSIDEDSQEIIIRQRKLMRNLSVQLFWETLHQDEFLPAGTRIKKATMHRFLKAMGLAKRVPGPARARSKYETPFTNDLWIADYMHGPKVLHEGKKRKAILCSIIDDHSRVLVGTHFSLSEQVEDILTVLREAIVKYGVPKKSSSTTARLLEPATCGRSQPASVARFFTANRTTVLHVAKLNVPTGRCVSVFYPGCRRTRF